MRQKLLLAVSLISLASISIARQDVESGKVLDSVTCLNNPSQTYSLYLPSFYSEERKWPVIFVFEPAARGVLPVRKFQKAAEELGYIVISSNNSKNGSWEISFDAADAIFNDGATRFMIDSSRIYTSGFSGGSRVAVTLAVMNKEIDGVIGCGAGLSSVPDYQPTTRNRFVYVGLVGDKDMNYQEHMLLEEKWNALAIPNHRIVFSGPHQWPAPDQLKEAVNWLELQSGKRGQSMSPTFQPDSLYLRIKSKGDSLLKAERLTEAARTYEQAIVNFEKDRDLAEVKGQLTLIKKMKQFKKLVKREHRLNERERKHQLVIDQAFFEVGRTRLEAIDSTTKTKEWWFEEIDSLQSVTESKNVDKSNAGFRLLNLIWAKFATTSFNYENSGDYEMAIALNEIWLHAEPKSVWALWNMSKLQAMAGEVDKSLDYLYVAFDAGMKFKQSLDPPAFDSLRNEERFIKLQEKLLENERLR